MAAYLTEEYLKKRAANGSEQARKYLLAVDGESTARAKYITMGPLQGDLRKLTRAQLHPGDVDLSQIARQIAQFLREAEPSRAAAIEVQDDLHAHATAPRIGRPGLIVHDLEDTDVPWCEGERYARYWPQATLLSTTGLGHHRVTIAPETLDASLRFLRGGPVGQRVVSTHALPFAYSMVLPAVTDPEIGEHAEGAGRRQGQVVVGIGEDAADVLLQGLAEQGAGALILGCTELAELAPLGRRHLSRVVDSNAALARAALLGIGMRPSSGDA